MIQALYKKFAVVWFVLTVAGLTGIAVFNILIDPSGAYPGLHLKTFEPFRYLNDDLPHKAEMARRGDWETIILGSSRAKAGLPATHPVLTTNQTCNLGVDGARFAELARAFEFARAHNPVKRVILCVDLYVFSADSRWMGEFSESQFNPHLDRFSYYCKQLLGRASTDDSWSALRRKLRHDIPSPQSQRGFFHHDIGADVSQRDLFDRVLHFMWGAYKIQSVDPAQIELFRQFVRECRDANIDLQIAIMPVHALDLELLYAGGRWPEFERWKGDLVNVLAGENVEGKFNLWDFSGYAGPPSESIPPPNDTRTRMKFYFENSHCTPVVGGYILDAMFGGPQDIQVFDGEPFGVKLTRANLKEHLALILEDRQRYVRANPAEIEWVHRIVAESAKNPS